MPLFADNLPFDQEALTVLELHISNKYAKKSRIGKKLIFTIRAVMLDGKVAMRTLHFHNRLNVVTCTLAQRHEDTSQGGLKNSISVCTLTAALAHVLCRRSSPEFYEVLLA